jgi:hypothetical protein
MVSNTKFHHQLCSLIWKWYGANYFFTLVQEQITFVNLCSNQNMRRILYIQRPKPYLLLPQSLVLQGMPLLQPRPMSRVMESWASWISVGGVNGRTDFKVMSFNHPYNYGSNSLNYAVIGPAHLFQLHWHWLVLLQQRRPLRRTWKAFTTWSSEIDHHTVLWRLPSIPED